MGAAVGADVDAAEFDIGEAEAEEEEEEEEEEDCSICLRFLVDGCFFPTLGTLESCCVLSFFLFFFLFSSNPFAMTRRISEVNGIPITTSSCLELADLFFLFLLFVVFPSFPFRVVVAAAAAAAVRAAACAACAACATTRFLLFACFLRLVTMP